MAAQHLASACKYKIPRQYKKLNNNKAKTCNSIHLTIITLKKGHLNKFQFNTVQNEKKKNKRNWPQE